MLHDRAAPASSASVTPCLRLPPLRPGDCTPCPCPCPCPCTWRCCHRSCCVWRSRCNRRASCCLASTSAFAAARVACCSRSSCAHHPTSDWGHKHGGIPRSKVQQGHDMAEELTASSPPSLAPHPHNPTLLTAACSMSCSSCCFTWRAICAGLAALPRVDPGGKPKKITEACTRLLPTDNKPTGLDIYSVWACKNNHVHKQHNWQRSTSEVAVCGPLQPDLTTTQ